MLKNKKGITLIALVITIIVLLILAGVALNAIAGENGILDKAKQAREQSELNQGLEEMQLGLAGEYINKWVTGDSSKYNEMIQQILTEEMTPKGLVKIESQPDATKFEYILEYNTKLYKSKASSTEELLNNMVQINENEFKKEHEIFLELLMTNQLGACLDNGTVLEETDTLTRVLINYNEELYIVKIVFNEQIPAVTVTLTESPYTTESPELASISTGVCCKFGLDKNGHVWDLNSDEYVFNINKLSELEDVVFTKISAGYENVLMLDSTRKNMGIW